MKTIVLLFLLSLNNLFTQKEKLDSPLMSFARSRGIELVELEDALPNNSGFIKVTFPVKDTLQALETFKFLKNIGWRDLGFATNANEDSISVYPQGFASITSNGQYYFQGESLFSVHKGTMYIYEESMPLTILKVLDFIMESTSKIPEYQITSIMEFLGEKKMKQVCFDLKSEGK